MRNRLFVAPLIVLAVAWPGLAHPVEFPPQGASESPMTTSPSGFVGVPGPGGYAPEHFQAFPPPAPAPAQAPSACPSCPAPGQSQEQHPLQPAQH